MEVIDIMMNNYECNPRSDYLPVSPWGYKKCINSTSRYSHVPVVPQAPAHTSPDMDALKGKWSYEAATIEWDIRKSIVYLTVKIYGCTVWIGRLTKENTATVAKGQLFDINVGASLKADFNKKSLCVDVKYCVPAGCRVFSRECVRWH